MTALNRVLPCFKRAHYLCHKVNKEFNFLRNRAVAASVGVNEIQRFGFINSANT